MQSKCQCILSKSLFWRGYSVFDQAERKKKKKSPALDSSRYKAFYVCLMTIFHLNANGLQQLLKNKYSVCWHPRMPSLLTDWETHQPLGTQSNGSIQMQCKWIFLGLCLWISLILIHVQWSLTCTKIQCNKGFSSTWIQFQKSSKSQIFKVIFRNPFDYTRWGKYTWRDICLFQRHCPPPSWRTSIPFQVNGLNSISMGNWQE